MARALCYNLNLCESDNSRKNGCFNACWTICLFECMTRFIANHKMTLSGTDIPECFNHMVIHDDSRRVGSTHTRDRCDSGIVEGWYRFINRKRMSNQCAKHHACNTDYPGWLVGNHPYSTWSRVTRKVCFDRKSSSSSSSSSSSCPCKYHTYITVTYCGSFHVYKLKPTPTCSRYCTT